MNYKDTCVVIPTYNEAATISDLVKTALSAGVGAVIVMDDGDDDTSVLAMLAGALVYRGETRLGLGESIRRGMVKAYDLEYKYVVVMDAGGTHDPKMIPALVDVARTGYQVVIASRFLPPYKFMGYRTIISLGAAWCVRRLLGVNVRDVTAGFRCYEIGQMHIGSSRADKFAVQIELFCYTIMEGAKFAEIRAEYKLTNSTFRWSMVVKALKVLAQIAARR